MGSFLHLSLWSKLKVFVLHKSELFDFFFFTMSIYKYHSFKKYSHQLVQYSYIFLWKSWQKQNQ